jgi:hypothetical protein
MRVRKLHPTEHKKAEQIVEQMLPIATLAHSMAHQHFQFAKKFFGTTTNPPARKNISIVLILPKEKTKTLV